MMRGKGIKIPQSADHHRPASVTCRCWPYIECWLGTFVIFKGIRASIAKNPYIFVIFQGGGGGLKKPKKKHVSIGPRLTKLSGSAHGLIVARHCMLAVNTLRGYLNYLYKFLFCFCWFTREDVTCTATTTPHSPGTCRPN